MWSFGNREAHWPRIHRRRVARTALEHLEANGYERDMEKKLKEGDEDGVFFTD